MRRFHRLAVGTAACTALVAGALMGPGAAGAAEDLRSTDTIAGVIPEPELAVLNDPNCRLSKEHPRPVVLVHGLGATARENWNFFAPYLAEQGFCVFARTYGKTAMWPGRGGVTRMEASAAELSDFVDKVRTATGAKQVDMVGHSEGGIMPRWYLKFLGGSEKVANFVSWAAPNHGTTVSGLTHLRAFYPGFDDEMAKYCQSCPQFMLGSPFLRKLNAGDETPGKTRYTVLATRYDWLVTPVQTSFLRGANNVFLQDVNPATYVGHVEMAWDPTTFELTEDALNALAED